MRRLIYPFRKQKEMSDIMHISTMQPRHVGRDFCRHLAEIEWGESLLICGTGPDVLLDLSRAPRCDTRLAVNGAIAIDYDWTAWAAMDKDVLNQPYAERPPAVDAYLGTHIAERFERCAYTFRTDTNCLTPCPRHVIRGDSTIAGAALHMAYNLFLDHCTPHTVYLCGIQMQGGYYTGALSYQEIVKGKGTLWNQIAAFNAIIAQCLRVGMTVAHVGATALEVTQV